MIIIDLKLVHNLVKNHKFYIQIKYIIIYYYFI